MKIIERGVSPSEWTYRAQCKYCFTKIEFAGAEAVNYRITRWLTWLFKHWKLVSCPVCENTIRTEYRNGYRTVAVPTESA